MKNFFLYLTAVLMMFALIGCSESSEIITESYNEKQSISSSDTSEAITEDSFDSSEESEEYMIYIKTENSVMEAKLCENQSAAALYDLLKENDITVNMSDYGNFENIKFYTLLSCRKYLCIMQSFIISHKKKTVQ